MVTPVVSRDTRCGSVEYMPERCDAVTTPGATPLVSGFLWKHLCRLSNFPKRDSKAVHAGISVSGAQSRNSVRDISVLDDTASPEVAS